MSIPGKHERNVEHSIRIWPEWDALKAHKGDQHWAALTAHPHRKNILCEKLRRTDAVFTGAFNYHGVHSSWNVFIHQSNHLALETLISCIVGHKIWYFFNDFSFGSHVVLDQGFGMSALVRRHTFISCLQTQALFLLYRLSWLAALGPITDSLGLRSTYMCSSSNV